jgi:hypothetical protein
MIHTKYVYQDFIDVESWHQLLTVTVVSTSVFLAFALKSLVPLTLCLMYAFGFHDIIYYYLERGFLPEKFYGVWIVILGKYEPSVGEVVQTAKIGLMVLILLFLIYPVGEDGIIPMAIYKRFKRWNHYRRQCYW